MGEEGGGQKMPTCRHYPMIHMDIKELEGEVGGEHMPACRHADNEIIAHRIFYRKKKVGLYSKHAGIPTSCVHHVCLSAVKVGEKGGGSKHADMPTCRHYPMIHMGIKELEGEMGG